MYVGNTETIPRKTSIAASIYCTMRYLADSPFSALNNDQSKATLVIHVTISLKKAHPIRPQPSHSSSSSSSLAESSP